MQSDACLLDMVKPPSSDTKRITATLDGDLAGRLEAYCANERLSLSQGISRAVEHFLNHAQSESEPNAAAFPKRAANS